MVTCHSYFSLYSSLPLKWVNLPRPKLVNRQDTNTIILVLLMPHCSIHIQKSVTCFRFYKNRNQEKYQKWSNVPKKQARNSCHNSDCSDMLSLPWLGPSVYSVTFSLWFIQLLPFIKVSNLGNNSTQSSLRMALKFCPCYNHWRFIHWMRFVIESSCYLCGEYSEPVLTVNVLISTLFSSD